MAYDAYLAERISQYFSSLKITTEQKKMMGGLCFMVDGKMCCGIHFDKKRVEQLLMVRIGEAAQRELQDNTGVYPMDFTGRPMKGYLYVSEVVLDEETNLEFWLNLCIKFNPQATRSKKKR